MIWSMPSQDTQQFSQIERYTNRWYKKYLKVNKCNLHIISRKWKCILIIKGGRFLFLWKRDLKKFFFVGGWRSMTDFQADDSLMANGYLSPKLLTNNWTVVTIIAKSIWKPREIYIIYTKRSSGYHQR